MPLARIKGKAGYPAPKQAQDLICKATDAVISLKGEGPRRVTIGEVQSGTRSIAAEPVTGHNPRDMAPAGN